MRGAFVLTMVIAMFAGSPGLRSAPLVAVEPAPARVTANITKLASASVVRVAQVGERGTPFRGVAIGDTRKQVNIALGELGLRCMTKSEKELLAEREIPLLETLMGVDSCRIIRQDANMLGDGDLDAYLHDVVTRELVQQSLLHAILFEDGHVSEMRLQPSYFNAEGFDGWAFTQSIIENYMQPGWSQLATNVVLGRSASGDVVAVYSSPNGRQSLLVVKRGDQGNTPTFN